MKAKIINNQIIYESNFMFINSLNNYVSNPTNEMLLNDGFKEVQFVEVDEITTEFEENENNILIYCLKNFEV